jgi:hypothetical protein
MKARVLAIPPPAGAAPAAAPPPCPGRVGVDVVYRGRDCLSALIRIYAGR